MYKLFIKYFSLLVVMITASISNVVAQAPVKFEISFKEPQAHYAEVKMQISDIKGAYIDVKMPVWTPGSYLVREFSKNVEGFEAVGTDSRQLASKKITKNTWRVFTEKASNITIAYRVYAYEVSVRTSFIDQAHAFLSPAGLFMYVDGQLGRSAEVTIQPHDAWSRVSTGLEPVAGKQFTYTAPNFDVLFDSPIEVGNQDVFEFMAAGVPHEVAMYGGGNYDKEKLRNDMALIVERAAAIFGENPNKRYVFIVHNYQSGGGGLEHLNSTVLGASRFNYATENGYKSFLSLVAHEYFHLWNIKRLRPAALGPFDYDKENYTTNLWIGEGFTAYYDNLLVRRAGFYSEEDYLQTLAADVSAVENRPGNKVQPLSESSFDAWIKYYRPDENSINTGVSYYNKGALMAMLMDIKILQATGGEKGLDDVMREAYTTFYKKRNQGFTDEEFKELAEKIAGISLDDVYQLVNTTNSPDYNKYLQHVGLELIDLNAGYEIPDIGIKTSHTDGKLLVQTVLRDSEAWNSGINVKDELIAVNGYRIDGTGKELDRVIQSGKVGDSVKLIIARDGVIQELSVVIGTSKIGKYSFMPVQESSPEQQKLKARWLAER